MEYEDGGKHADPPWKNTTANPTVSGVSGTKGRVDDDHYSHSASQGPAASYTATQYYGYHCSRCGQGDGAYYTLGWYVLLKGPITITRYVEQDNEGKWRYKIEKDGKTATWPLNF